MPDDRPAIVAITAGVDPVTGIDSTTPSRRPCSTSGCHRTDPKASPAFSSTTPAAVSRKSLVPARSTHDRSSEQSCAAHRSDCPDSLENDDPDSGGHAESPPRADGRHARPCSRGTRAFDPAAVVVGTERRDRGAAGRPGRSCVGPVCRCRSGAPPYAWRPSFGAVIRTRRASVG
jgi:hypothetical protein